MRESMQNFMVGATSIGAIVGFGTLLLLFGELDAALHPRYVVTINTDHAVGLRSGSHVELNGVPIGVVDKVLVRQDALYPVQVIALINGEARIPDNAVPYATTSLLGGASILAIEAIPSQTSASFLAHDGTAIIAETIKFQMIEQITAELDARMTPLLDALDTFEELSSTYITLGRNLNELVATQNEEDLAAGATPNLHTTVARFFEVVDKAEAAVELARDWLADEQIREGARNAVENAGELIEKASATLDRLTAAAGSIETNSDALTKRLLEVSDELAATLEEVRRVSRLAAAGDGTVGKLLNDPGLYNSLNDAAVRLQATLRLIQLFMEKVEAEGVPINL